MTKLADNDTVIYQAMCHKNVEFMKTEALFMTPLLYEAITTKASHNVLR